MHTNTTQVRKKATMTGRQRMGVMGRGGMTELLKMRMIMEVILEEVDTRKRERVLLKEIQVNWGEGGGRGATGAPQGSAPPTPPRLALRGGEVSWKVDPNSFNFDGFVFYCLCHIEVAII